MDAYNPTPVWQMYNLPAPSSGGQSMSDGGESNPQQMSASPDKVGGAIKSGLEKGIMSDVGLGGATSGGAASGIIPSISSSLMAAFGL